MTKSNYESPKDLKCLINENSAVFIDKIKTYGASFRVMRVYSCIEQIQYKINSLISIENGKKTLDNLNEILTAIFNYSITGLIQLELGRAEDSTSLNIDNIIKYYQLKCSLIYATIVEKEGQYGSSWLRMNPITFTDIMLTKIMRVKYGMCKNEMYKNEDIDSRIGSVISDALIDIAAYTLFYKFKSKEQEDENKN